MPRAEYNVSRQRSRGNPIAISALLTWRGRRLRSLRTGEGQVSEIEADIAAIDRVLVNVLGFNGDIAEASRDFRREALFRRGELKRAVLDVLRQANGPLTTRQITARVMAIKGKELQPGRVSKEWINRVRKVCQKLETVDTVRVDGVQRWKRRA
ncbi:MAG: hypothetical protein K8H74_11940 [Notoacmeibacter sp.]|nr:hypothetical protein [Notoacmeibacter sp.]